MTQEPDYDTLLSLARQKAKLDAGRIEFLEGERARYRGELHKARGDLDGARRSLERAHRLLGAATERCDALKASRDRAYAVVDAHANRIDEFVAATARGNLEELGDLAKAWRDRE